MNPVEPECRSRDVLTRLNGVRTLNLRRTLDEVRCQIVPPASGTTQPLHLEQKGLASPQRILGSPSVVDVGSNAVPSSRAIVVNTPDGPYVKPAIRAIRAPQARLGFDRLARLYRAVACSEERRQVVRMHHVAESPLLRTGYAGTVELPGGAIVQFERPRRVVDRHQGWNVVEDLVELPLARPPQDRRPASDPRCRRALVHHPVKIARRVPERRSAEEEPSILAVAAAQARFDLARRTRGDHCSPVLGQAGRRRPDGRQRPTPSRALPPLRGRCTPASAD